MNSSYWNDRREREEKEKIYERCRGCGHVKDKHNIKNKFCRVKNCKCKEFEVSK